VIKSRRLRWASHIARMKDGRTAFKILTGKSTGKTPSRRPRHRWEDNIRMNYKDMFINIRNWDGPPLNRDCWRALVRVL